jgi:cation transport protein ChaC
MQLPSPIEQIHWVFGYGSLIWNPGFDHGPRAVARVHGFHRAFCIESTRYRGTHHQPGVVLGLLPGGSVTGVAFALNAATRERSLAALYEREMLNDVYVPRLLETRLADGRTVQALTFVANRAQSAVKRLAEHEVLHRLRNCCGDRGANRDYAISTWKALRELGLEDSRLARLARALELSGEARKAA